MSELPERYYIDYGIDWDEEHLLSKWGVFIEGQYYGPHKDMKMLDRYNVEVPKTDIWNIGHRMRDLGFCYSYLRCDLCNARLHWKSQGFKSHTTCRACMRFEEKTDRFFFWMKKAKEKDLWDPDDKDNWPIWMGGTMDEEDLKQLPEKGERQTSKEYYEKNKEVVKKLRRLRYHKKKQLKEKYGEGTEEFKKHWRQFLDTHNLKNIDEWFHKDREEIISSGSSD